MVFTMNPTNRKDEVDYAQEELLPAVAIQAPSPGVGTRQWRQPRRRSMKLSTRSRYGTRLMMDMAQHYREGPIHLGDIAKRQDVSVKYLEQIIIPLKKAHYIESVRGSKGGHILTKPPEEITVGEIVAVLEEGTSLVECAADATVCERADICPTRLLWKEAAEAMFDRLAAVTLAHLVERAKTMEGGKFKPALESS
jgi:Rrf2 family iron-sulfur cluster assembly transcriptional regulator